MGCGLFAILWLMLRLGLAFWIDLFILNPFRRHFIFTKQLSSMVDSQMITILQNLYIVSFRSRDPVEIAVKGSIAVLVGTSLVNKIGWLHINRQLIQIRFLIFKGSCRNQPGLSRWSIGQPICCPHKGLPVQILHILKFTSGKKIGDNSEKPPFIAGFPV